MLNYTGYICAVSYGQSVFGAGSGPVWLSNLACSYIDRHLDDCGAIVQTTDPCFHSRDAAVICQGSCYEIIMLMSLKCSFGYVMHGAIRHVALMNGSLFGCMHVHYICACPLNVKLKLADPRFDYKSYSAL